MGICRSCEHQTEACMAWRLHGCQISNQHVQPAENMLMVVSAGKSANFALALASLMINACGQQMQRHEQVGKAALRCARSKCKGRPTMLFCMH